MKIKKKVKLANVPAVPFTPPGPSTESAENHPVHGSGGSHARPGDMNFNKMVQKLKRMK